IRDAVQISLKRRLDRTTDDVLDVLGVDIAMVSVLDHRTLVTLGLSTSIVRLRKKSRHALNDLACGQVVQNDRAMMLEDARKHSIIGKTQLVREGLYRGYLGVAIHDAEMGAIGAVCAATVEPRAWTDENLKYLQAVALSVENILLREMYRLESADASSLASEYDEIIAAFALVRAEPTSIHDATGRLVFANRALTDVVGESELESENLKSVLLSESKSATLPFLTREGEKYRLSPSRTSSGYLVCQWSRASSRLN
ncbi:MAG: GAF domain-containing protein, partial [Pseudomonadota bacterium]